MKLIIEARLVDDVTLSPPVRLATINRELSTEPIGLSLAEGKEIMATVQRYFVWAQCAGIADAHAYCDDCGKRLIGKGHHDRQIRTVFGRVTVCSPRFRFCTCTGNRPNASFSPLLAVVPTGITPELEYLQVKWSAHLSYASATSMLCEVLPTAKAICVSSVKRRVRVVGAALAASHIVGCQATPAAEPVPHSKATAVSALAVDSGWLKHCDPPRTQGRHVNLVAGRACFEDGHSRVYAYVHNQVSSAASRLDRFLATSRVDPTTRVTILTDGEGEFDKAAKGCSQPICHLLDWFHIAMKFKAAERSVLGCKFINSMEREGIERRIRGAKWLVWHGKASQAVARLKELDQMLLARTDYEFGTLWWNLHGVSSYIHNNAGLVNYARRHYKGLPVSSSIAESAVNQVVSLRMAKKRQMRWSNEGAHLLAQVRVNDINGDLKPRKVAWPLRPPRPAHDPRWDAEMMLDAA
jgi:hypothetical protein